MDVSKIKNATTEEAEIDSFTVEPVEFDSTCETKYCTNKMMEGQICAMLAPIFNDLRFVSVSVNDGTDRSIPATVGNGELIVNLYFSPNGQGQGYQSVIPTNNNSRASSNAMLNSLYRMSGTNMNRSAVNTINELTKKLLTPYMFDPRSNWRNHIYDMEDRSNSYSNKADYYVGVLGLSLGKFVNAIYGPKDENGDTLDYQLSVVRNIVPSNFSGSRQFLISISRMNRAAVREIAEMTNAYYSGVSFGTEAHR